MKNSSQKNSIISKKEKLDQMIFNFFRFHNKNRFEPKFNLPKKIIIKKKKKFFKINIFFF